MTTLKRHILGSKLESACSLLFLASFIPPSYDYRHGYSVPLVMELGLELSLFFLVPC